ncbi:hypothetical protein MTR67_012727 [Solanum verrucosum]|uniref:Uncharacterized protein n=1 Tax=Solanum verrucosum TaxID=315347 RepID=A0AAF0TG85_SOLVR|nr:hypothetical protein MTR67_012727 [Solanum verrucosum]
MDHACQDHRRQKQSRVGRKKESNPRIETVGELSKLVYGGQYGRKGTLELLIVLRIPNSPPNAGWDNLPSLPVPRLISIPIPTCQSFLYVSWHRPTDAPFIDENLPKFHCLLTVQLFLLFMSFSLAVEALHAFIQDESEHKRDWIRNEDFWDKVGVVPCGGQDVGGEAEMVQVCEKEMHRCPSEEVREVGYEGHEESGSIVNNLSTFTRQVYRKAEDMNYHSVCLHVLADSIRRVKNAEVLCLGLVSATVFFLVMPLFRTTGGILLQMAPPRIPSSALSKCWRQIKLANKCTPKRLGACSKGLNCGAVEALATLVKMGNMLFHYALECKGTFRI